LQPSVNLPAPAFKSSLITGDGYNSDIITTLNSQFSTAVTQCSEARFSGNNLREKGRAIYNYLRNTVKYKKDPEGRQLIQLPSRLINGTGKGDCKSLALAAAAFMYCNGFRNVRLRYTSYKENDSTPTHVYTVGTDENGRDIIIDAVYNRFNKEVPYKFKKDYKMEISVLSGTPPMMQKAVKLKILKRSPLQRLQDLRGKIRPGGLLYNVITNEIARQSGGPFFNVRYTADQVNAYKQRLGQAAARQRSPFIRSIIEMERKALEAGNFNGSIYTPRSGAEIKGLEEEIGKLSLKKLKKGLKKIKIKSIFKGVKAVALVSARKAFLTLVNLNVRGLAKRMSKLSEADLQKFWVDRFAGKLSVLKGAISRGAKKRPLFGASKKVKAIKGIGVVLDESINTDPGAAAAAASAGSTGGVSLGAIIAAAAPVLVAVISLLKRKGIPSVPENAAAPGEAGDFTEADQDAAEQKPKLEQWIEKAANIARETGIIPDKPETITEAKVSQAIPGDDLEADPAQGKPAGFQVSPVILIGGAAAAFLLLNRKKSK
jgi:hypothetical protein